MTSFKNDQNTQRITDRVSNPLLMATFLLSLFVAFTDKNLVTNLGISSWVPSAVLLVAVFGVFVQLFHDPIQASASPRETADTDG